MKIINEWCNFVHRQIDCVLFLLTKRNGQWIYGKKTNVEVIDLPCVECAMNKMKIFRIDRNNQNQHCRWMVFSVVFDWRQSTSKSARLQSTHKMNFQFFNAIFSLSSLFSLSNDRFDNLATGQFAISDWYNIADTRPSNMKCAPISPNSASKNVRSTYSAKPIKCAMILFLFNWSTY